MASFDRDTPIDLEKGQPAHSESNLSDRPPPFNSSQVGEMEKSNAELPDETIKFNSDTSTAVPPVAPTQQPPPPASPEDNPYGPKIPLTSWRKFLVFLGITSTLFLAALDQTIVSTTLPATAKQFNNFGDISWVGTSYLLTTTAVQPIYGAASNMFGRKRSMLFAAGIFMLGSVLSGAAQSMTMLIIARAIQGLGGSGIIALSMILVADIVPLRERGTYQGLIALIFAIAAVLGPLLGGIFSDSLTWRWAYFINLPVGAMAVLLIILFMHMKRPKDVTFSQNMATVDFTGILLLVISIVMILLALNWGADARYPWSSATIISLIVVGLVICVIFLWNEWKIAKKPIIPLRLFSTWSMASSYLCVFFQGFVFLGLMFLLPLYFQAVSGVSAIESGVNLLPFAVLGSVTAIVVGMGMSKFNTYKEFIVAGFALSTIASGLLITLDEHSSRGKALGILVPQGISMGLTVNTLLLGVHAQLVDKRDIALATSLWTFLRTLGGTMGIAAGSALIQSSLSSAGAAQYANNINAIHSLPLDERAPVLRAFVVGLNRFCILITVISGVSLVASLFIKKIRLGDRQPKQKKDESSSSDDTPAKIIAE
ncbi:hypothetical protein BGZ73_008870 [Actinomortierella ambigua]|nr:hypothetical protein BGZ73_008870 [Actinomortierella ambigua]